MSPPPPPAAPPPAGAGELERPPSLRDWFAKNAGSLVTTAVLVALVLIYLNPIDVLKVVVGLGLVIFIHELGHFLAAKWCDVHVKTFSIGFGPPLPGCQFKYGETTYKLALIPLGGYVYMVGESEGAESEQDGEEAEEDPRSFKNKSVYQRMLIISAGVIMNVILAAVCFVIAYSRGVEERPAIVGRVESGSAAWRAGLKSGMEIEQIGGKVNPFFADVQQAVMSTGEGEQLRLVVRDPDTGERRELWVEPTLEVNALYPLLGFSPAPGLELLQSRREGFQPFQPGSAAAKAEPPLRQGDRIVGCTDPDNPGEVTPLPRDPADPSSQSYGFFELYRRLHRLQGKPVTLQVERKNGEQTETILSTLPPDYHRDFGLRMQMGQVTAVRKDSPAERAVPEDPAGAEPGVRPRQTSDRPGEDVPGDKLIEVKVTDAEGNRLHWVAAPSKEPEEGVTERVLDPVRLPWELEAWAGTNPPDKTVRLTVLRQVGHKEARVTLRTEWDDSWRYNRESVASPNSPLPVPGLGLAYQVQTVVDAVVPGSPAEKAGMRKGDVIKAIRPNILNEERELEPGRWIDVESHQWAAVFSDLQHADSPEVTFRVVRGKDEEVEITVRAEPDTSWPRVERGLILKDDTRLQKADGIAGALGMGVDRTVRVIKLIYQSLTAMIVGRVSAWTMSGPLTIADVSYKIAGENIWQFILFIGLISVNLAVINFLPIPVLDGGHMVFLIYEMIRGKPAPEWVQSLAIYIGLALILSLMAFVIFLDVRRLWF